MGYSSCLAFSIAPLLYRMDFCVVCKGYHDNSTPKGRRDHEKLCPISYRKMALNTLINDSEKQLHKKRSHLFKTLGNLNVKSSDAVSMSSISAYSARPDTSILVGEQQNARKKRAACELPDQYAEFSHRNVCYDGDSGKWSNYKSSFNTSTLMDVPIMDLQKFDQDQYVDEIIDFGNHSQDAEEDDNVIVFDEDEDSSSCECVTEISVACLHETEEKEKMISSTNVLLDKDTIVNSTARVKKRHFYSSREEIHIELASILCSINAPAHVYNKIFKWARKATPNDLRSHIQYKTLMSQLARSQGLEDIFPSTHVLPLPSGNCVKVTKFSFRSQLKSLLSDQDLMNDDNLIFGGNILKRFDEEIHCAGDVESSTWYRRTQKEVCKLPNDVLCPIILYIDKTYAKSHPVEPISFTLGMFE